jgi:(2R)-ethylmalonyl-CoA mutase
VQVNSLGLTEAQPENNIQRIVLEMLGVTLSRNARAPRRPATGLERGARPAPAWDQQWSLRMQQVLAFESDLLQYPDLFDGSHVVEGPGVVHRGRRPPGTGHPSRRWAAWWPPSRAGT